jgi:protein-disulfide isomerase
MQEFNAMETTVKKIVNLAGGALLACSMLIASQAGCAQDLRSEIENIVKDYLATHPDDVGAAVKAYMLAHPEVVAQILLETLKQHRQQANADAVTAPVPPQAAAKTPDERGAAVASNASQLFSSPHQVTLGDPDGKVTLVEFFDYSCGYCKRALPDMLNLLKDDPKLKVVLKEFPILGPGSVEAARVAIAVRMQDPGGQKYLAFHKELLGISGPASKDKALGAAKNQGLDMARLQQDIVSDEVSATLAEDMKLAGTLGITGTPGYVVGNKVVIGAVGLDNLKGQIDSARTAAAN